MFVIEWEPNAVGVLADQLLARRLVDAEGEDLALVGRHDVVVPPAISWKRTEINSSERVDAASMSSSLIVPKLRSIRSAA